MVTCQLIWDGIELQLDNYPTKCFLLSIDSQSEIFPFQNDLEDYLLFIIHCKFISPPESWIQFGFKGCNQTWWLWLLKVIQTWWLWLLMVITLSLRVIIYVWIPIFTLEIHKRFNCSVTNQENRCRETLSNSPRKELQLPAPDPGND